MTRRELEALGHTDAQLDRWYEEHFGGRPGLAAEAADTPAVQARRGRVFRDVMIEWQGVHRDPTLPKIGAYAHTDAEEHARRRREQV